MLRPIFIRISVGPFLNPYLPFSLQGSILPPWASAAEEDLRAPSPGSPEEDSRQEGGVPVELHYNVKNLKFSLSHKNTDKMNFS